MSTESVPAAGGTLEVHRLGNGPQTVLALHGITANGLCFLPLAERLDGVAQLIAPDLRGRAGSRGTVEPAGLRAHADDVISILDALSLERVVLVGHSMGGYVAAMAAARYPDRFSSLVLVDGGIAFPPPPGADLDAMLLATLGPAMQRLTMTFPDPEAYLSFFAAHPALGPVLRGPHGSAVESYLRHDIVPGPGGGVRSSCVLDVVRADGAGVLADPEVHAAAGAGRVPGVLLRAENGMLGQPPGLIPEQAVAAAGLPESLQVELVPGTDHYSILLEDPGLRAVSEAVSAAVSAAARVRPDRR